MRKILGIAVFAILFTATPAHADQNQGLSLGLRLGLGFPIGKADGGATTTDISESVPMKIPIWFEAGYRFDKNWYLGAYFQWGPATTKNCPPGDTCSASDQRLGVNFHYRFDSGGFVPWVGAGFGYEWLNATQETSVFGAPVTIEAQESGFEFLSLQVGGDWTISPAFKLGPYLCFSIAQFTEVSASVTGFGSASGSITDKAVHEWLQVGLKGTFDL